MQTISMADINDFVERVALDGKAYRLHFSWNDANNQWMMDVRDDGNADMVKGIAIVPNFPLLVQYQRHGLPRGELMAIVNDSTKAAAQGVLRDGFVSGRFTMVYIPEAEKNELI